MIRLGSLNKNVIIIGEPDSRFPFNTLFQNLIQTKCFMGKLYLNQSHWIFSNKQGREKKVLNHEIQDLFFGLQINEVIIFICKNLSQQDIYRIVTICRNNSIGYYLVPDITKLARKNFWKGAFSYIPVIESLRPNRDSLIQISFKRIIDLILVVLSSVLFFPISLIIAIAIKVEDGGSIFYISKRVGKNGRLIKFYKFRSMVKNADKLKQGLLKYNERRDGPLFKMSNDPRVTHVGRIIRKYSLDELPQIINVIKGEMSIVGPRPHLIHEVEAYSERDMLRLECIPGITCFPQIMGRNSITFREWVDLDLLYRKKWSLLLDFKILAKSLSVVVSTLLSPLLNKKIK